MANQFIQQGNQNLLWKIINNTPQMIQFFTGAAPGDKERWFQQIIGHVYEEHAKNSQGTSLRDLNKIAIDLMVDLLRKAQQAQAQAQAQTQAQAQAQTPVQHHFQNSPIENIKPGVLNTTSMESQFELRRKEYENMTKKTVPTPAFKENVKDEAIGDIGSAVNEYMKQRELDSKMFAPPVAIEVEEIDNNFTAKKVKWGENTEHVYATNNADNTQTKILEMLEILTKKVDAQSELIKTLVEKHIENK
jgi:hypothetical protein